MDLNQHQSVLISKINKKSYKVEHMMVPFLAVDVATGVAQRPQSQT